MTTLQIIARPRPNLFVVTGENPDDTMALQAWAADLEGHVFRLAIQDARSIRFVDLGAQAEACREPVNIVYEQCEPPIQLISNLAHTPFGLGGRVYASVEAFWQGLKHRDEEKRAEIAGLHGQEARRAGFDAPARQTIEFERRKLRMGTHEHWALMKRACNAKFEQHEAAREALVSTGTRPLEHRVRRDSKTIPGVIMADIWMRIRKRHLR